MSFDPVDDGRDRSWVADAACRGTMPEPTFFAIGVRSGGDAPSEGYAEGRAVCARCPVTDACLEYGLREPDGLWGGLSPRQRARLRRERRVAS